MAAALDMYRFRVTVTPLTASTSIRHNSVAAGLLRSPEVQAINLTAISFLAEQVSSGPRTRLDADRRRPTDITQLSELQIGRNEYRALRAIPQSGPNPAPSSISLSQQPGFYCDTFRWEICVGHRASSSKKLLHLFKLRISHFTHTGDIVPLSAARK